MTMVVAAAVGHGASQPLLPSHRVVAEVALGTHCGGSNSNSIPQSMVYRNCVDHPV